VGGEKDWGRRVVVKVVCHQVLRLAAERLGWRMMAEAICLRCGSAKGKPWETCTRCRFDPTRDEDSLVRSAYLSVGRFDDPAEQERYRVELDRVGGEIQRGLEPAFAEAELARLARQRKEIEAISPSAVWGAVARLFLPAAVLIAALFGLAWAIRLAR
jgi:hypothetical protein